MAGNIGLLGWRKPGAAHGGGVHPWFQRPGFVVAGTIVAFAASWTGTQTGLIQQQIDRWERERLAVNVQELTRSLDQPEHRWGQLRDFRWHSLTHGATNSGLMLQGSAIVKDTAIPKDPKAAMALLKRLDRRWFSIDLGGQRLTAWEGNRIVKQSIVSTGKASTPTPPGVWQTYIKLRSTRMRGPGYDVPNVPYTMYYHQGYGIHGAYWHNSFGTPVSQGCTNVRVSEARWYFNWAPMGTPVVVHR